MGRGGGGVDTLPFSLYLRTADTFRQTYPPAFSFSITWMLNTALNHL